MAATRAAACDTHLCVCACERACVCVCARARTHTHTCRRRRRLRRRRWCAAAVCVAVVVCLLTSARTRVCGFARVAREVCVRCARCAREVCTENPKCGAARVADSCNHPQLCNASYVTPSHRGECPRRCRADAAHTDPATNKHRWPRTVGNANADASARAQWHWRLDATRVHGCHKLPFRHGGSSC